jgi:hypothetical protein
MDCRKDVDMQHVLVLAEEQKIPLYIMIHMSNFLLILTCPFRPKYSYITIIQEGSNMTGTDLCVNKPHKYRSYLNHLVFSCRNVLHFPLFIYFKYIF